MLLVKPLRIFIVTGLFMVTVLFFSFRLNYSNQETVCNNAPSDTAAYLKLKDNIKSKRDSVFKIYCTASNDQQEMYLKNTEELLLTTYYKTIIPKWLGTKWEFYGETQIPGDSSIACGHFFVTTLKHLGIRLENSHEMATNYSAYMVNSLCDTSFKVFKAIDLLKIVEKYPDDIWVVGLRSHSGLLIKYKGQIHFVHSSCTAPTMVVDELAEESSTFQGSTIYVSGPLFKNNSLSEKWIIGEEVKYTKKY
jgi:hypothetical protein